MTIQYTYTESQQRIARTKQAYYMMVLTRHKHELDEQWFKQQLFAEAGGLFLLFDVVVVVVRFKRTSSIHSCQWCAIEIVLALIIKQMYMARE